MLNFLFDEQEGRFLIIGSLLTILGFILTILNNPFSTYSFYAAMFFLGFFAAKDALVKTLQDKTPNVDLLMILAALGAALINYESEGAVLLFIFALAEFLEEYATNKSSKAIEELMSQVPETANLLLDNGDVKEVQTDTLLVGDIVIVSKGNQVPIDGQVDRQTSINEAALTGESAPVEKKPGDQAFAGTINEGNAFELTVEKTSDQTMFSSIVRMVEEAQRKPSRIAKFIDRFESKYVVGVLIAVPLFILGLYSLADYSFAQAFYRGMVLLTVASPCALVASATPATLSAISNGAKNGILFKGGAAMEAIGTMDLLYSDKTGTLTYGAFSVANYEVTNPEILKEVIYMEQQSSHPIAQAIVSHFSDIDLQNVNKGESVEEIAGSGLKKAGLKVGKPQDFEDYSDPNGFRKQMISGNTMIFAGYDMELVAYFSLVDQVRPSASHAVESFKNNGIDVQLITGDNQSVAEKVAKEMNIKDFQAECLPKDKIDLVNSQQDQGKVVGMIGDGINDAPALAAADVGVAMGSGSSVAMESSDVVVVQNDLEKLFYSYRLSKKLNRIIMENIIFAVSVMVILIILNLFGILDLPTGVVFHEGSTILVILNGLRMLAAQRDKQPPKKKETLQKRPAVPVTH